MRGLQCTLQCEFPCQPPEDVTYETTLKPVAEELEIHIDTRVHPTSRYLCCFKKDSISYNIIMQKELLCTFHTQHVS